MQDTVIAIPSMTPGGLDAYRSGHFGRCDSFTLVEIKAGQGGRRPRFWIWAIPRFPCSCRYSSCPGRVPRPSWWQASVCVPSSAFRTLGSTSWWAPVSVFGTWWTHSSQERCAPLPIPTFAVRTTTAEGGEGAHTREEGCARRALRFSKADVRR